MPKEPRTHRFLSKLFSATYKSLFPQLPSFHIYTKRRGGAPFFVSTFTTLRTFQRVNGPRKSFRTRFYAKSARKFFRIRSSEKTPGVGTSVKITPAESTTSKLLFRRSIREGSGRSDALYASRTGCTKWRRSGLPTNGPLAGRQGECSARTGRTCFVFPVSSLRESYRPKNFHLDFFFTHRQDAEYAGATMLTRFGKSYVTSAESCVAVRALSMWYSYSTVSGKGLSMSCDAKFQVHKFSFAALTSSGLPSGVSVKPNRPSLYTRI